jgi:hypothetical protein
MVRVNPFTSASSSPFLKSCLKMNTQLRKKNWCALRKLVTRDFWSEHHPFFQISTLHSNKHIGPCMKRNKEQKHKEREKS